jgi:transcriptional regulator with XRE-family HTH domain
MTNNQLIANRIKELRKVKFNSQKDFANIVGFSYSVYNRIENGEKDITVEEIYLIANGLEVSPSEIIMENPKSDQVIMLGSIYGSNNTVENSIFINIDSEELVRFFKIKTSSNIN